MIAKIQLFIDFFCVFVYFVCLLCSGWESERMANVAADLEHNTHTH